jgi:hypothetical protein
MLLLTTQIELKSSSLDVPSSSTGRLLWRYVALRKAYGHKVKWIALGQRVRTRSNCLRTLQEVADGLLGNAILKVRIHTKKGELLLRIVACLLEGVVVELPVVAVVVEDLHSVFGCVLLEGKLGGECLCQ